LNNILKKKFSEKISLATIYNTVHAFKKKGYLKEITTNSDKNYFDTNVSYHHHFFNELTNELIDLKDSDVNNIKIKKNIPGKKIKSIEVLVKIANNN
jgi:Fur family iron response transcriptional regulator